MVIMDDAQVRFRRNPYPLHYNLITHHRVTPLHSCEDTPTGDPYPFIHLRNETGCKRKFLVQGKTVHDGDPSKKFPRGDYLLARL